jgi:enoyl-CoA hydratase/carnithine racemase
MATATTNSINGTRRYAGGKMLAAKNDGIGLVTFNQPEKRNAISIEMWQGLGQIFDEFAEDNDVRVVVMTGAGDRAFVSGADISQFEAHRSNAEASREYDRIAGVGRASLAAFPKPIIARIRGFCLGGGLWIAMHADLRIASLNSTFGIPAARLGVAYGLDGIGRLVDLVGPAHARMILYSARQINALEAERIGLINQAVEVEDLESAVTGLAHTIANNAPLSVASSKLIIDQLAMTPPERDMEAIRNAMTTCMNSADFREGRTAFMEKRQPRFQGR